MTNRLIFSFVLICLGGCGGGPGDSDMSTTAPTLNPSPTPEPTESPTPSPSAESVLINSGDEVTASKSVSFPLRACDLGAPDGFIPLVHQPSALDDYAWPSDVPDENGAASLSEVFDRNNDGWMDYLLVVFHTYPNGSVVSAPGDSTIVYLENQSGTLVDRTIEVFGKRDFDYVPRQVRLFDLNRDGVLDIYWVMNNEDGRRSSDEYIDTIATPSRIFLSQADGTYSALDFGFYNWSHDGAIADIDNDGAYEVIDAGYYIHSQHDVDVRDATYFYGFSDNNELALERDTWVGREIFDANTFVTDDFTGDGCPDLVAGDRYPRRFDFNYYVGQCDGTFRTEQRFPVSSDVITVPGETWNGEQTEFSVLTREGHWYVAYGSYWARSFDVDQDGDLDVLYNLNSLRVSDADQQAMFVHENNGTPQAVLYLLKNVGGRFEWYENPVIGAPEHMDVFWAATNDINNDGFPDLVVDDWQLALNDAVYLNDGRGQFHKLGFDLESSSRPNDGLTFENVDPIDVNNDGIIDFISRDQFSKQYGVLSLDLLVGQSSLPSCVSSTR